MVIPRDNLCLVCNQTVGNARNSVTSEVCHRFSVLASRFLNLQSGKFSSLGTLGVQSICKGQANVSYQVCCNLCQPLVESFSQIYEQWHYLQIQLNWKANELSEVMQMSDADESAPVRRGNSSVSRFRKEFMQKASQRSTNSFPKLTIEALSQDTIDNAVNNQFGRNFGNGHRETSPRSGDGEPVAAHRCPHCSMVLYSSHFYEQHLAEHIALKKSRRGRKCASMYEFAGVTGRVKVEQPEKLHGCSYCHKRFSIRANLMSHELIHTGEKPYKCRFCLKDFRQRGHLVTHYNRIHKDNVEIPKGENETENIQRHGPSKVEQGKTETSSRPAKRIRKAKSVVATTGNETKNEKKRANKRPGPWSSFAATEIYWDGFEDDSSKRDINGD